MGKTRLSFGVILAFVTALFISINTITAQQGSLKDSSLSFSHIGVSFGFHLPAGDLGKRFGYTSSGEANFTYKLKSNFMFGVSYSNFFGDRVKEDNILDSLKTSEGFIIDAEGREASIKIRESGHQLQFKISKITKLLAVNPNSGITFAFGVGWLQHKIKIEDVGRKTPQLSKEYVKGYDRLTSGFSLYQFVGYTLFSSRRLLNFYGGLEITEGFTQNRRSYDFDLMRKDTQKRKDILMGLRIGIIIPLYGKAKDFYTN